MQCTKEAHTDMAKAEEEIKDPDLSSVRRAVAGAAMGNTMEWFDYGVYSYVAVIIGHQLLGAKTDADAALLTFLGLAVSFLLRPLGGLVFGPLGDRLGRQKVLATTIIMMAAGTFAIGLIPSFDSIGYGAPVLLVLARVVQGFSTGGEYGSAATFIAEYAPDKRRGFFGSFLEFGTLVGFIMGASIVAILQAVLSTGDMESFGWRIPFLIAGPLGMIGFYLRSRLEDSPAFRAIQSKHHESSAPLKEVFANNWQMLLRLAGIVILLNVADYTVLTYMPTYLQTVINLSSTVSNLVAIAIMVFGLIIIVPLGALSDRVGRKPLLLTAAIGYIVFAYPAYWAIGTKQLWLIVLGLGTVMVLLTLMLAVVASSLPAMFPTRNRAGAFSIGYAITTALFGGTASYAEEWLGQVTGSHAIPAYYTIAAALIAIIPIITMPETKGVSLRSETETPGLEPVAAAS